MMDDDDVDDITRVYNSLVKLHIFQVNDNEEIYIILFVKEAQASYFRMSTHKDGKHFKKCVWTKIPLIFYWFLLFLYNSLENQTEQAVKLKLLFTLN